MHIFGFLSSQKGPILRIELTSRLLFSIAIYGSCLRYLECTITPKLSIRNEIILRSQQFVFAEPYLAVGVCKSLIPLNWEIDHFRVFGIPTS